MEMIDLGIMFLIGFVLGEVYLAFRLRKVLESMVEAALEEEAEEESLVEVYKLKTESTNDSILLYNDQDQFICQGKTIEELAILSKENYGISFAAVMHHGKIVMFMNGAVRDIV